MDELEHHAEVPHQPPDARKPDSHLTVVGIGASAGGLEALTELLRHLPSGSPRIPSYGFRTAG